MRSITFLPLCIGLAAAAPASASSFKIIANIGAANIGGIAGETLYGTAPYNGAGQLFSLTTSGTYTLLHSFTAGTDGQYPSGRLAVTESGFIYGTTSTGGAYGGGTFWVYNPNSKKLKVLHAFGNPGDGAAPMQGPSFMPNGPIYDTTGEGAIGGSGNIFSITRYGEYTVKYQFMSMADGHCPFSGVGTGPGGTLYGTSVGYGFGGNPNGSVWQFTPSTGALKTLYVFKDGADGEWPNQAPVADGFGNVYGVTNQQGGPNGASFAGVVWKITAAGTFSIMHPLNAATDGLYPNSPLILNADGKLYGTTYNQGPGGYGTLFSITKSGQFQVVHAFSNLGDGTNPMGNLIHTSAGVIYGGTSDGAIFQYTP